MEQQLNLLLLLTGAPLSLLGAVSMALWSGHVPLRPRWALTCSALGCICLAAAMAASVIVAAWWVVALGAELSLLCLGAWWMWAEHPPWIDEDDGGGPPGGGEGPDDDPDWWPNFERELELYQEQQPVA